MFSRIKVLDLIAQIDITYFSILPQVISLIVNSTNALNLNVTSSPDNPGFNCVYCELTDSEKVPSNPSGEPSDCIFGNFECIHHVYDGTVNVCGIDFLAEATYNCN